jgi:hypothetical protein
MNKESAIFALTSLLPEGAWNRTAYIARGSLSGRTKIRKIQLKFLTFKTVPYPQ